MHYRRWQRNGDPEVVKYLWRQPVARFWAKVDKTDTCWLWTGVVMNTGYGQHSVGRGRSQLAHRFAYELLVGPIPAGLHIDHLCRVPLCVNPAHLEPVTNRENARRGLRGVLYDHAARTHCKHGHELTPENTYVYRGSRCCRACHYLASKRWDMAQRERKRASA